MADPRPTLLRQEVDTPEARLGFARDAARKLDMAFVHLWGMQILPRAILTPANQSFASTTWTAFTGLRIDTTPAIATRFHVTVSVLASVTGGAGSTERLWVRLLLNGAVFGFAIWGSGADSPHTMSFTATCEIAGDTAAAITVEGRVSAAGPTFTVDREAFSATQVVTTLSVIAMPNLD